MLQIHKRWRADYNKKEAIWKRSVSISHSLFCSCPSYTLHFTKKCPGSGDGGVVGVSPAEGISFVTEDGDDHGGEDTDAGATAIKL
ncbi:ORF2 [Grizzly bear anellovirus 7]|nr:ORF2 [Grizzly bear anellovirus 7]